MYSAGWSKRQIAIEPQGYAMQGYGMWNHRARGVQLPLYSRALFIRDQQGHSLIFCCLDLGYITHAMRQGICERLAEAIGKDFDDERLVLTCTHTHSGPGGCSHDALYNLVTPGFVAEHVLAIIEATVDAILQAWRSAAPTVLTLSRARFADDTPVAWNRSLDAYNQNPETFRLAAHQAHLALDRSMPVLAFRRDNRTEALLSLFGVHATCVGNRLGRYDGDNKGYAAHEAEQKLAAKGIDNPVAIFAQGTAGDVSPHYHGPGDLNQRRKLRGEAEYAYARRNGSYQTHLAFEALGQVPTAIADTGTDALLSYIDFTNLQAAPEHANGNPNAHTSEPCHGVAFFAGTRVDGPGMPAPLANGASWLARRIRQRRLAAHDAPESAYHQHLYRAQGNKDILMETGRKLVLGSPLRKLKVPAFADPLVAELKRQARLGALDRSAMVPTVLPLQIVRIGQLALVCCPGEFTTIAGQRLRETVARVLAGDGIEQVLICTYCNDYMGYVTTNEEYQLQRYEGGHTIFGQWTLAAFQTEFARLAKELGKPTNQRDYDRQNRPDLPPPEELALRANLTPPR